MYLSDIESRVDPTYRWPYVNDGPYRLHSHTCHCRFLWCTDSTQHHNDICPGVPVIPPRPLTPSLSPQELPPILLLIQLNTRTLYDQVRVTNVENNYSAKPLHHATYVTFSGSASERTASHHVRNRNSTLFSVC